MSVKVSVISGNLQALAEAAAREATEVVMEELAAEFQAAFSKAVWDWPRETQRTVGTVGSPRNIIDTDNLRQTDSWQMTGPYQATFKWSANYATAVHEGARIYPGGNRDAARVQLPARPWTRAVLGQENVSGIRTYNIGQRLRDIWLAKLRRP
jgi:hypothetical protein